jgi:Glycosyltransferase family 20
MRGFDSEESGPAAQCRTVGSLTYAVCDLSRRDIEQYYNGFANRALWPICHYRLDLANLSECNAAAYFRVNEQFARQLHKLLRRDDIIWVHDYQFAAGGAGARDDAANHAKIALGSSRICPYATRFGGRGRPHQWQTRRCRLDSAALYQQIDEPFGPRRTLSHVPHRPRHALARRHEPRRQGQAPDNPGVLVLSQFAGAAQELKSALIVNPYDIEATAAAIARAFTMPLDERKDRWHAMMAALRANSVHVWASHFLQALANEAESGVRQGAGRSPVSRVRRLGPA